MDQEAGEGAAERAPDATGHEGVGVAARRWRVSRARVALAVLALAAGWFVTHRAVRDPGGDLVGSLTLSLASSGLEVDPAQVVWLEPASGWFGVRPVLFVARRAGQLEDVYFADVRVARNGGVFGVHWLTNVTRSSSAKEGALVRVGHHVAYTVRVGEAHSAIGLLDVRGEPSALTQGWPLHARVQNAISNFQECGRFAGFGRTRYTIDPPSASLRLSGRGRLLHVAWDDGEATLDPARAPAAEVGGRLRGEVFAKGEPGTITWLVDTVRNIPWVGPRPIEWLEHAVFGMTDRVQRAYHAVAGEDSVQGARDARAALAGSLVPSVVEPAAPPAPVDPEIGLPPPRLVPVLPDAAGGEGEWVPVIDPAFVNAYPGAPPAFWQTFLQVDPERRFASIYVTLWDPRQVQLHVTMGTREPESATGETGTGLIPRDAALIDDLVAGFNGAFQALHGEFGAMADRRVYLPPKPFAATVVVRDDGRVALGSWPGPGRHTWDEEVATRQIPADVISLRQNLTSVVEDGRYNPWERWYWGAAPEAADEQTYIGRSGLCLTRAGFMAFLWGESMGPEQLGKAMLALDCVRGMHLDMNTKHTGFEFYRAFRGGAPAALGRELTPAEFEGSALDAPGVVFRSRLAVSTMAPIRFPRYLDRDPRDFFYLTLKRVLPGPPIVVAGKEHVYATDGLPRVAWPRAFARLRLDVLDAWLVRIDARRAVPTPLVAPSVAQSPASPDALPSVLAYLAGGAALAHPPAAGEVALFVARAHGRSRFAVGRLPKRARGIVAAPPIADGVDATAALGVDREGFVLYAEAGSPELLREALAGAGVERALALSGGARLAFVLDGQTVAVDGTTTFDVVPAESLAWMAEARPAAEVLHPELKPTPYRHWGWQQDQRVRYFPQHAPRFPTPEALR